MDHAQAQFIGLLKGKLDSVQADMWCNSSTKATARATSAKALHAIWNRKALGKTTLSLGWFVGNRVVEHSCPSIRRSVLLVGSLFEELLLQNEIWSRCRSKIKCPGKETITLVAAEDRKWNISCWQRWPRSCCECEWLIDVQSDGSTCVEPGAIRNHQTVCITLQPITNDLPASATKGTNEAHNSSFGWGTSYSCNQSALNLKHFICWSSILWLWFYNHLLDIAVKNEPLLTACCRFASPVFSSHWSRSWVKEACSSRSVHWSQPDKIREPFWPRVWLQVHWDRSISCTRLELHQRRPQTVYSKQI